MLSPEAREQLSARLTEATEQETTPTEEVTAPVAKEDGDTVSTAPEGSAESGKSEPDTSSAQTPDGGKKGTETQSQKTVPLEEHIRIRQERKQLREQNQQLQQKLAQLDGYLAAKAQEKKGDWLDELLGGDAKEEEPEPDPRDKIIHTLKSQVDEIQFERGQNLLRNTIADCQTKDPTVDPQFLIDEFKVGRTPDQALAKWNTWKSKFGTGSQTTQSKAAPPPPPPTVNRAPAGKQSTKPHTWGDVSQAVKRALSK